MENDCPVNQLDPGTQWDPILRRVRLIDVGVYAQHVERVTREKREASCDECGCDTKNHIRSVHRRGKLVAVLCVSCGDDDRIVNKHYSCIPQVSK